MFFWVKLRFKPDSEAGYVQNSPSRKGKSAKCCTGSAYIVKADPRLFFLRICLKVIAADDF